MPRIFNLPYQSREAPLSWQKVPSHMLRSILTILSSKLVFLFRQIKRIKGESQVYF